MTKLCSVINPNVQSCAIQSGRPSPNDFQIPSLFAWKSFFCQNLHLGWIFGSASFKISDFTPALHLPAGYGIQSALGGRKLCQIWQNFFSHRSQKKCTLFIWEGRRPPWPSWQEAPSGWGPRNAWKCSLWKPSPCTAGQCRYLREQLKYEKISSENEFTVKVELSLCTGGQCHDLETKMKMKVLKNIFWAVIFIIGVGWRIRMDYWDDQDDEDGGGNDNEMLTDFEINFGEVVKVRGVVNGPHLKIKMLKI